MKSTIIDRIFDLCVDFLIYWAKVFGITYNEINVYIFCIIWPILTIGLIAIILWQWRMIRNLKALSQNRQDNEG